MGLLCSDVTVVPSLRIDLSLRAMKNDTFAEGHSISLAWKTTSGVLLGEMVLEYTRLLRSDGVPLDAPFLAPTSIIGGARYAATPAGSVTRFNHIVRDLLLQFFPSMSEAERQRDSFHSLRRGGASWARYRGCPLGLVIAQGLWNTVEGARSYIVPSDEERVMASHLM